MLRLANGQRIRGKLQVVSTTGGLLQLATPVERGARVKVMFHTDAGTVQGSAEMLASLSDTLQPFRFTALDEKDGSKLRRVIQLSIDWIRREQTLIDRTRAW